MDHKILNLHKIKVLSEVCKTNSYRIVSKNLYLSPSAISKIIKSLEVEWHVNLVQSTGNSIKVTEQAEVLAVIAEKMLEANDEFNNALAQLKGRSPAAILQIGSGATHSRIIMNRLMASFLNSYTDFEYEVVTCNSAEIFRAFKNDELNCGVVSGALPNHINKDLIYEDNISLYAHQQHPLAAKKVKLDEICYPICLREKGSSTRLFVEQYLADKGRKLHNTKQTGKNDELTGHLCKTLNAVQFLSDFYYRNSHWKDEYVKIDCDDLVIPIPVYFITCKNFPFPMLRKHVQSLSFQDEILAS
jgi:DNA-binding transcriptional LysR family regulator